MDTVSAGSPPEVVRCDQSLLHFFGLDPPTEFDLAAGFGTGQMLGVLFKQGCRLFGSLTTGRVPCALGLPSSRCPTPPFGLLTSCAAVGLPCRPWTEHDLRLEFLDRMADRTALLARM